MTEHIQIGDVSPRIQYVANGTVTTFTYPFPIFENGDLLVYLDDAVQTGGYAVAGAGETFGGTVDFSVPPVAGAVVTLTRRVPEERTTDFQEGGAFRAVVINTELDRIVCMAQQLRDDLSRSVARPATSTSAASLALPDPAAGRALKWNAAGDALVNSAVDPDTLASAAAAAQAAQAAAETARGLSETARDSAQGSAAAAASDAAAVAAALASLSQDKVRVLTADTVLTSTDNGQIFAVDAAAGQVVVTLPLGAVLGEPGGVSVQKTDDTAHPVLVRRQGTDTINGAAADYELSSRFSGARFAIDEDTDPDNWVALPFGVAVGDATPVGLYADFPGSAPPAGWLIRNGAAVSRTVYPDLFAAIGTTFGAGDGSTTFNLPNDIGKAMYGSATPGSAKSVTSGTGEVPKSEGTNVGDMTEYNGLAAAFDGNANQVHTACALRNGATAFVGKYYSGGKVIDRATVVGSNNYGFTYYGASITLNLRGANAAPSYGSGTLLATATVSDANSLSVTLTGSNTTSYTYYWVEMASGYGSSEINYIAELTFFAAPDQAFSGALPCIKAFNAVSNPTMIEVGALAADHEARIDALEVALAGIEEFPGVQGNLVTNETEFPIGTVVFAKIDSAYIDRNKAAAVYVSSARSDLYTLSSASGLRLAGTWVARGTDQSYGTELMQRVA